MRWVWWLGCLVCGCGELESPEDLVDSGGDHGSEGHPGDGGPYATHDQGVVLWQRDELGENLEASPAIDHEGNIYTVGGATLYAFTPSGSLRWSTRTTGGDSNSPSVAGDRVFVCGVDGVFAVDIADGSVVWHQDDFGGVAFHTVPAISTSRGRVYLGTGTEFEPSHDFFALEADTGEIAWRFVLDAPRAEGIAGFLGGTVIAEDGTLFVSSQHGLLVALQDEGDHATELWRFDLEAEARQPASIADERTLFMSSNAGVVHKIDARTGEEITERNWPALGEIGEVFAPLVLASDGSVYVTSEDRRLRALDADGVERWSLAFEDWTSDPLLREDGTLLVMCQLDGAGRVCGIEDRGDEGVVAWTSSPIVERLSFNETNLNIGPDGTIYVHSGDQRPLGLFAVGGNGSSLNTRSPWPKYMGNVGNSGVR
jgi:outer membrane protein assembly factor BamB